MSLRKIGYTLYKIAKQGDTKTFLRYVEQNKIFNNLQTLSPIDSSQLIYSFSVLKISDKKIWQGLEELFLIKEQSMNLQDIVMCASAFSKSSQNIKIWRAIESYVVANQSNIFEVRDIVMLFYSFANVRFNSPSLWIILEKLSMISPYRFNTKELTMLAWSFGRVKKGSSSFWNRLEQIVQPLIGGLSVQNLSIIAYSFSKVRHGSPKFWDTMEKALKVSIPESKKMKPKPRDIVNIVWAFKNLDKGSVEFWEILEKAAINDIGRFTILDLTNIAYSFLNSKMKHAEFWKGFDVNLNSLPKIKDENHQEVVILAEILTRREYKDPKIWNLLGEHFSTSMKKGLVNNSMFRARWHKRIYEMQPKIWDQEIERIYIQSIEANIASRPQVALMDLFNICFCAFPHFGQQAFWENLLDKFLILLDSPEVITSSSETVSMASRIIYILTARFSECGEPAVSQISALDEKLDNLYRDEKRFLLMTQEKFSLLTQLKAFVLKRSVHLTLFWTQLKKHQDKCEKLFNKNDIRPLIFAIIVKNKLFFNKPKYEEFNQRIQESYKDFTEEQVNELIGFLWNELLTHYTNYNVVLSDFSKNPLTKNLDIKSFILGKEEAAKQKKVTDGLDWFMDDYHQEVYYVEDDSEHDTNISD